jgi:BASS family bile acid:Na+ symporter
MDAIRLDAIPQVLAYTFLVLMMFSIGLEVKLREIAADLRNYSLMGRALLANLILAPIAAFAIVKLFHLNTDVAVGFLLLAVAPGAVFATNFTTKAQGGKSFAAALLFILVAVSLVYAPVIANLILPAEMQVSLPYGPLVVKILLLLVLPMFAGLACKRWMEKLANVLLKPASLVAALAFVAFMVMMLSSGSQARSAIGGSAVVAMLVFIAAAMLIGWLLGGPDRSNRQVMATGTSMRNVAVALLLAQSLGSAPVQFVVAAFFSLMVPCNLLLTIYETVRNKRANKASKR